MLFFRSQRNRRRYRDSNAKKLSYQPIIALFNRLKTTRIFQFCTLRACWVSVIGRHAALVPLHCVYENRLAFLMPIRLDRWNRKRVVGYRPNNNTMMEREAECIVIVQRSIRLVTKNKRVPSLAERTARLRFQNALGRVMKYHRQGGREKFNRLFI